MAGFRFSVYRPAPLAVLIRLIFLGDDMRNTWIFAFSALALVGCRDGGSGDDTPGVDAPGGGENTIQEVQNDSMAPGAKVVLKGVIVTAIDNYGGKTGDFWVQEPEGGPYSGVHVYGAPLDAVAGLVLGDIVDISNAQKEEFALTSDTSGNTLTELEPVTGGMMTVTKIGPGTPATPQVVDALAIGQLADYMARNAEWEKWEGVLVTVSNVSAFGSPTTIGTSDPTLKKFSVTGDIVVESALAVFPAGVSRDDCFVGVTGVVDYFFDYLIFPRTTDEIATGGSACPAKENLAAACTDGIDNDGNGFKDCGDNNCIPVESTCRTVTTISAIQTATTPPTGGVELQNVYVAALSKPSGSGTATPKNMWVQTSLQAAANEGVYIYGPGSSLAAFTVGSRVNIIGTVEEFNDDATGGTLTEIKALSITAGTTGTGTVLPVAGQTVTDLNQASTGEPYEGVLVTLTNVMVTTVGTTGTGGTFGVGAAAQYPGAVVFKTDDDIFLLSTANACYSTIRGVWTYLPYENAYGFLALAAGTAGGNCQ